MPNISVLSSPLAILHPCTGKMGVVRLVKNTIRWSMLVGTMPRLSAHGRVVVCQVRRNGRNLRAGRMVAFIPGATWDRTSRFAIIIWMSVTRRRLATIPRMSARMVWSILLAMYGSGRQVYGAGKPASRTSSILTPGRMGVRTRKLMTGYCVLCVVVHFSTLIIRCVAPIATPRSRIIARIMSAFGWWRLPKRTNQR